MEPNQLRPIINYLSKTQKEKGISFVREKSKQINRIIKYLHTIVKLKLGMRLARSERRIFSYIWEKFLLSWGGVMI